jgi:hypothetical protein
LGDALLRWLGICGAVLLQLISMAAQQYIIHRLVLNFLQGVVYDIRSA